MQDLNDKVTGSTLTAAQWNEIPSEIQQAITDSGQVLSSGDLGQLSQAIGSFSTVNKASCVTLTPINGKLYFVGGTDGGLFKGVTGAAPGTYSDNGGSYCGTQFIPTGGDGSSAWLRVGYEAKVNLKWFGVVFDGLTSNADAFELAASSGAVILKGASGTCILERTVEIPVGVYIEGVSSTYATSGDLATVFAPLTASTAYYEESGSQTANGYLFFMNVLTSAPTNWVQQFPNVGSGGARHCTVDGTNTGNIKGFYFAGSYEFEDIRNIKVSTSIRAVDSLYQDHINIKRIFATGARANQTDFLIYLDCLGDSCVVTDIASGYTSGQTGITKCIYMSGIGGGEISHVINGEVNVYNCNNVKVKDSSLFGGRLIIDDCNADVENMVLSINEENDNPITINSTNGSFRQLYSTNIKSCKFFRAINDSNNEQWPTTEIADIKISSSHVRLKLEGQNVRISSRSGTATKQQMMGIIVEDHAGSTTTFDNYSHLLSSFGTVMKNAEVDITGHTPKMDVVFGGWVASPTTETITNKTWQIATDTYYYGIQLVIDPVRELGRPAATTSEVSIALTNGGDLPRLQVNLSSIKYTGGYILRVFRGTATGSYDKYVNLPCISVSEMHDDGNAINGFPWQSRAASAMNTLNNQEWMGICKWTENRITLEGGTNSTPAAGTWRQGDELKRYDGTVDGNNMLRTGYWRLTDGANHVLNTDWVVQYISTVTPAT